MSCQNRWRQSEFILGTFWDPPVHIEPRYLDSDLRGFRLARDAGFNLLTGTQIEPNIDRSFDGMKCALKLAWQTGLQYLVADERFYPAYGCIFDKSKAKELVDAYKKLPASLRSAMFGYNLCDEPYFEQDHFKSISQWKWLIETSDPSKLVYLNLASSYAPSYNWGGFRGGNEDRVLDANERDEYESYLSLYIDNLRPTVISFDHYPFFADGTIRRDYYYNLSVIRRKAGKRPFWAYPMTVGHLAYSDPSEAQLNFMYFCPIAYGAKGLIDFCFWTPSDNENYRESLIDANGEPTRRYFLIKRLNLYVRRILEPVVMRVPNVMTYHVSSYPQNQLYISDEIGEDSTRVLFADDEHVMVGVFANPSNRYLLVVNKSLSTISSVRIHLKGQVSRIFFSPRVVGFTDTTQLKYRQQPIKIDGQTNTSTFLIPELIGGEGRLVRLGR